MKQTTVAAAVLALAVCPTSHAVTDPEQSIQQLTPPFLRFDWIGQEGVTWFVQGSDDLEDWYFFPLVDYGVEHDPVDFTSSSGRHFMRLWYTDVAPIGGNPAAMDFDGDGIPSLFEVSIFGTNPLLFDTDGGTTSDAEKFSNPALDPATNLEVFTPFR